MTTWKLILITYFLDSIF